MSPALAQVNGPGPSPANLFDTVLNLPGDEAVVTGVDYGSIGGVTGQTTQLNVNGGGEVAAYFDALSGSEVNISGGTLGDFFDARSGSEVNISGGSLGRGFRTVAGSHVQLIGGEFHLNGADFSGSTITLADGDVFTGTLSDGSSFIFSDRDELEDVTLTASALPAADLIPIVISAPVDSGPFGLRTGQTLTLQAGGSLHNNLQVVNATLNVEGGILSHSVEASNSLVSISGGEVGSWFGALSGSEVTIIGGTVGSYFDARSGSEVNISGGTVARRFAARSGSEVNISGGEVGSTFAAISGSEVNISGGTVGSGFAAFSGSEVNISSGTMGYGFEARSGSKVNISGGTFGSYFCAKSGSDVELIGGEFHLNGADFSGSTVTLTDGDIFTGTLSDGSSFIFSDRDELEDVTLTSSALPAADPIPMVINAPVDSGPFGLRAGQTMTLQAGGHLRNLQIVDATLNVEDGSVGVDAEASNSVVNISGGTVDSGFNAYDGSVVNISGGYVSDSFVAHSGSVVNISGGSVGEFYIFPAYVPSGFEALSGSEVNISGGWVGEWFVARSGSEVTISGGNFGEPFSADSGSVVRIFGSKFFIDDEELNTLVPGEAFTITDRNVKLSGRLANGQQISYYINSSGSQFDEDYCSPNATLTVTLVSPVILGDVNLDGVVDFLDINPFIAVLTAATFQAEADCDENGVVDFLDINHFIGILSGN